jgi:WS/DGAT/MGAT family acyltransferase
VADHLTALDATFLELEESDPAAHMHIGGVMVFEPPKQGRAPRIADLSAHLESRLRELPRFRQRLSEPRTGGLSWPSWEEVPGFRAEHHIRRESLPVPGGEAELLDWAGEFFSERLDRSRPLWEMVVVEGLSGGRWALATKTHHCMVDGVGSVDIGHVILDGSPEGREVPARQTAETGMAAEGADRSTPRRLAGAGASLAKAPLRLARGGLGLIRRGTEAARHPQRAADAFERSRAMASVIVRDELIAAPASSINAPIGGKRRLAVSCVPLAELKAVKNGLGGTVNDVVLAMTAGGLRRLLLERDEPLPPQGLRAMVPMNVRTAGEQLALGNRITSLFVHLPVGDHDPLARYEHQRTEAESLKSGSQALGSSALLDVTGLAPPVFHSFLARSLFATRLFNLTITNVPGPALPLYAFGSRMTDVWPLVPLAAEHTIALAVFSYDGKAFFTFNADRDAVPDLEVLARGIEEAFAELREAALASAGR